MSDRYGTRYISRLSFDEKATSEPVDTLRYYYPVAVVYPRPYRNTSGERILLDIELPPVSPPPPSPRARTPPPAPRKPAPPKKRRTRRNAEISEQELRTREAWAGYYGERTPLFLFELREKVRESYKPPPPHYRAFSKMVANYFYPEKKT